MINVFQSSLGADELQAVAEVFESNWLGHGPRTKAFEEEFGVHLGVFYTQSAVESAQLMLTALVDAARPVLRLGAIRDLGWPVGLLDLALGVIVETGGTAPLYLAGYDPGYEQAPYPGLYDPQLAGDVSPLVNAMEAPDVRPTASPDVDVVPVRPVPADGLAERLPVLKERCAAGDEAAVRGLFAEAAWDLLVGTVRAAPPTVVARLVQVTGPYRDRLSPEHRRMDDVFRDAACPSSAAVATAGERPVAGNR